MRETHAGNTQDPARAWPPRLDPVPPSCKWAVSTPSPPWQYPTTKALSTAAGQCQYTGCGAHSKGRTGTNSYLFLPFPVLKCLVVANSAEGHLRGLHDQVTTSEPGGSSSQRARIVGSKLWPYHCVEWDDGRRHEGMEEVVYPLPENEPC